MIRFQSSPSNGRPLTCSMGFVALALFLALAVLPQVAHAQVVVLVNGEPITELDIKYRSHLIQLSTRKAPSRKEVLDELVDEKLKVREARRFGMVASKSQVDRAFDTIAKRMGTTDDQLAKSLASAGSNEKSLKARLGADMVWQQLVRGRFQSSFQIREKDVLASINGSSQSTNTSAGAYEFKLTPILVVVPRGSPSTTMAAKKREAEALRNRFTSCETGLPFARALRDVVVREQITRSAASLAPQLRKMLDDLQIGHLTTPEVTANGIEMFALCERKQVKDDSPELQAARNKLMSETFERKSEEYLKDLRRGAMIEHRR